MQFIPEFDEEICEMNGVEELHPIGCPFPSIKTLRNIEPEI